MGNDQSSTPPGAHRYPQSNGPHSQGGLNRSGSSRGGVVHHPSQHPSPHGNRPSPNRSRGVPNNNNTASPIPQQRNLRGSSPAAASGPRTPVKYATSPSSSSQSQQRP